MRPSSRAHAVLALTLLAGLLPLAADAAQAKRFPIGNRGALELQVPDGWTAELQAAQANQPATVQLAPTGRDFLLLISAVPLPANAGPPPPERIRAAVDAMATAPDIKEHAAESPLPIDELRGPQVVGYFFSATDKTYKPGPGEYHYISQGQLVIGSLAASFSMLSNTPAGPDRDAALELLRSARHAAP
jgi:hypothetical protein